MTFSINTDTDTLTFPDGLAVNLKFFMGFLNQPAGTIVEWLGPTEQHRVAFKTHPPGSTIVPPQVKNGG